MINVSNTNSEEFWSCVVLNAMQQSRVLFLFFISFYSSDHPAPDFNYYSPYPIYIDLQYNKMYNSTNSKEAFSMFYIHLISSIFIFFRAKVNTL